MPQQPVCIRCHAGTVREPGCIAAEPCTGLLPWPWKPACRLWHRARRLRQNCRTTHRLDCGMRAADPPTFFTGTSRRPSTSAASSSNWSRVIMPEASTSFMMHSTLMGASGLVVSTFLTCGAHEMAGGMLIRGSRLQMRQPHCTACVCRQAGFAALQVPHEMCTSSGRAGHPNLFAAHAQAVAGAQVALHINLVALVELPAATGGGPSWVGRRLQVGGTLLACANS